MKEIFEIEVPKRGAAPLFKAFHVLKAMHHIRQEGTIGRKSLAEVLDVGEGSVRGLIKHLEEQNLAGQTDSGLKLTKKASRFLNDAHFQAGKLEAGSMTVDDHDFAIRLKNICDKLSNGIVQRDEAIKVDASGATTVLFEDSRLILPDHYDVDEKVPEVASQLTDMFELENGDLIIIGTGPNTQKAEDGAFAAAVWILS